MGFKGLSLCGIMTVSHTIIVGCQFLSVFVFVCGTLYESLKSDLFRVIADLVLIFFPLRNDE